MNDMQNASYMTPELAAILQNSPVIKRYGVVQFEEKPMKVTHVRHEVLKIQMKRSYPTPAMRSDLTASLPDNLHFCTHPYFRHPATDKKENTLKAQRYLEHLESQRGFINYYNRIDRNKEYRDVIERFHYSLKTYIEELNLIYQRAVHVHFLHEILFIKNLQTYPFPKKWITLIAFYHKMPEYERLLAAIRVVIEYDGDRAPEFDAELY